MGNCLPKFKKNNKVHPGATGLKKKKKKIETKVSEILSRSSASISISSLNSTDEELEMVKKLTLSDVESTSVESLIMKKEDNVMDDLKQNEPEPVIKKPVFFQVDFVQGMRQMPSRLAERLDQKLEEQNSSHVALNDEDEYLMNQIMEEVEAKEKLERLREQLTVAQSLRELHLQSVRNKARGWHRDLKQGRGNTGMVNLGEGEVERGTEQGTGWGRDVGMGGRGNVGLEMGTWEGEREGDQVMGRVGCR